MVCQYVLACICILFRAYCRSDERGDINVGFAKYFSNNGNRIGTYQDSWQKNNVYILYKMVKTQMFSEHEAFKSQNFCHSSRPKF
jgi:hypothetical protein